MIRPDGIGRIIVSPMWLRHPDPGLFQHWVMEGGSSSETDRMVSIIGRGGLTMEYFAGLDVSMEETHVCVVDRDGEVIRETKVPSTPVDIEVALRGGPACR